VGVNVTLTVQDAPTAIEVPQLLVCANGPLAEIDDTLAAALPVLLIVTVWAALVDPTTRLPKDRDAGEALSVGPEGVPLPVRLTVLVAPPALTVRVPVREPVAVGVKVTLTVQDAPAAIEDPQLLVWAKSPLVVIDETDAAELVVLETDTVCAALVVPTTADPKFSAVGATVTPEFWKKFGP
jgi:hypothetical protein